MVLGSVAHVITPNPYGRSVSFRQTRSSLRIQSTSPYPPPTNPSPPAFETAAASLPPETLAIGARTIGYSRLNLSVSVDLMAKQPRSPWFYNYFTKIYPGAQSYYLKPYAMRTYLALYWTSTLGSMPSASTNSLQASKPSWKTTTPASGSDISIASRTSSSVAPWFKAPRMWLWM